MPANSASASARWSSPRWSGSSPRPMTCRVRRSPRYCPASWRPAGSSSRKACCSSPPWRRWRSSASTSSMPISPPKHGSRGRRWRPSTATSTGWQSSAWRLTPDSTGRGRGGPSGRPAQPSLLKRSPRSSPVAFIRLLLTDLIAAHVERPDLGRHTLEVLRGVDPHAALLGALPRLGVAHLLDAVVATPLVFRGRCEVVGLHEVQGDETRAESAELAEKLAVRRDGDSREVGLQEVRVTVAVGR